MILHIHAVIYIQTSLILLMKYRFTPEQIEKLLEIQWWYWDEEKINKYTSLMCNNDIDTFIQLASAST
jgi:hypothetical protein